MNDQLTQSINRARELLSTVRHAAMATVNEDGSPHNTPFLFLYNPELTKIYWGSHPDSLHSKNVLRTGQIFVVLYDAYEKGGLYIRAGNGHLAEGEELDESLDIRNAFRIKEGKPVLEKSYYMGDNPQRMYLAEIKNVWILMAERDNDGLLSKEYRQEISIKDLLS